MTSDDWRRIRELEDRLYLEIENATAGMVKLLPYSVSTPNSDGGVDKVQGYQTEGSDEQQYDYEGRRVWPFGIRSRPPKGVYGVWIGPPGRSGNGVIVGAESSRFGPSDLADGEVAFYNKVSGLIIRLGADGRITVTDGGGNSWQFDAAGNLTVTASATVTLNVPQLIAKQILTQKAGSVASLAATPGAALGAGGSISSISGHDGAFKLVVQTDPSTTPATGGIVANVTLESNWTNPVPMVCGDGTAFDSASSPGGSPFGATVAGGSNNMSVTVGSKMKTNTVYTINCMVRGWI